MMIDCVVYLLCCGFNDVFVSGLLFFCFVNSDWMDDHVSTPEVESMEFRIQ